MQPIRKGGKLVFADHPEFSPNLTPEQIFQLGSFGGTYWRNIYSEVTKADYSDQHKEFEFLNEISEDKLSSSECNLEINRYKVHSGTSLEDWESKNWIKEQDPYGWVQWYCRFYMGRRSDDDDRQIARWLAFAGPKGRFRVRLINMINAKKTTFNDYRISPVIRQGLQHWGYQLTKSDCF